jgi:putative alpha-1,2-mannosidase
MKVQVGGFKIFPIAGTFWSVIAGATLTNPPAQFSIPQSKGLDFVNLLIGNGGDSPNGSGGMIPSTAPPFGMTRWVAQSQVNYVSATPFNWTLNKVMGVTGTHQPAIWMGESGAISVSVGVGEDVVVDFEKRGLDVILGDDGQKNEVVSVGYYNVLLDDAHGGSIMIEQTASTRMNLVYQQHHDLVFFKLRA